ncbi:MAG: M48 family metalloprotease, partial [Proteobacteria bacterium]|nr:M48 family metalloprotease [Pseudomonadota bacterium]
MKRMIVAKFAVGIVLFTSQSCATNSEGRETFNIVSDAQMNDLGKGAYQDVISKSTSSGTLVPKNSPKYEVVERIGRRIAKASGAEFDWEFNVIDEPKTVNAFCLPGGKIVVYTGIFPVA